MGRDSARVYVEEALVLRRIPFGETDRILVLHEGRLTAELSRDEADEDAIMRAATGVLV